MTKRNLRNFAAWLLCWSSAFAYADISLEQIEQELNLSFSTALESEIAPSLKLYNKKRGNKALAFTMTENGGFALGIGFDAGSEVAASTSAMGHCQKWLQENERTGACEIVLLGEQILTPGVILRGELSETRPAMAWRVDGPRGTIYLIGTIHLLKSTLLPLPPVFDQFFAAADAIAFETNPILFSDPERQAELLAAMATDPKTQRKHYSKADRKMIKKYVKSQGIPLSAVYTAPPVINAMQISQLKAAAMGYSMATGVEMHYARQASTMGKAISELETPKEALGPLIDLAPELQVRMLTETIEQIDDVVPGIESLIGHWFDGDAQEVYERTVEDMVTNPELKIAATGLLDGRNMLWMPKIEAMLENESSTVVMVGSAHFGGDKGLLALLRERGFEPVQYDWSGKPLDVLANQ